MRNKIVFSKRIISIFLCICMMFSMCVCYTYAEEDGELIVEEEEVEEEEVVETTEEEEATEEEVVVVVDENEKYYFKGNDEYLKLEAYDVPEGKPGSFFAEAENGLVKGGIMSVVEDAQASGGKGIASGKVTRTVPEEIENVDARFRFTITEKGYYTLHARIMAPSKSGKATFTAFDDDIYRRMEYSTTIGDYVWYSSKAKGFGDPTYVTTNGAYLDVGVHVLNLKARNGGQVIDNIVLTKESWKPMGYGSLPGDPYRYTKEELEIFDYENKRSKLCVDDYYYLPDAEMEKKDGELFVPALNLLNMMGIETKIYDDYYLASYDRDYLKVYINSDIAIANGEKIKMAQPTYLYEDNVLMMPLSAIKSAFDFSYTHDESNNMLYIKTNFQTDDLIRREDKSIINTDASMAYCNYELKIDRPNAKVKVWIRQKKTSYKKSWVFTREGTSSLGYKGLGGSKIDYYWGELEPPKYENGVFKGYSGGLYRDTVYDMKVSVVDGDYSDVFIINDALHTMGLSGESSPHEGTTYFREYVEDEDWLVTNGELITIPTFESISCYIDEADNETDCEIYYKEKNDSQWKKAYEPVYDERVTGGQFRGSIVYLTENTTYNVRADIIKDGKVVKTKYSECTTWSSEVPIAKTINIADIYNADEKKALYLTDIKGTPDGWIKIVGDGKTVVDAGRMYRASIYMFGCEYLILENLIVKGGYMDGISLGDKCKNVRILNCDISEWGTPGVFNPWMKRYVIDGNFRNGNSGIKIWQGENIVVERCYIHDTIGDTNPWSFGDYYPSMHPAGTAGITVTGVQGYVIRWNDISGSDEHRFNDVIEASYNKSNFGGTGFDSDIYGNMFYCSEDDCLEVDSSGRNVRVFENRVEQSLCGISVAPIVMGPVYLFRNLIVNRGDSQNEESYAIKINSGEGKHFYFNNTMSTHISAAATPHVLSRNNITTKSRNGSEEGIADYDILTGQSATPTQEYEPHGIFDKPEYVSAETGNYQLSSKSIGVNAGETLDNFSDVAVGETDIGAFEVDGKYKMFPYRPIDIFADKTFVKISDKGEATLTFSIGEIEEGLDYKIHTNLQNEFLNIEGVNCSLSGKALSNTTYTVKIKADLSNHFLWLSNKKVPYNEGNGMIYLRLSNGFSVPVTVYVEK